MSGSDLEALPDVAELLARQPLPDWHRDALCIEYPDVMFFPERGQSTREAKAVCSRCAVRDECAAYAIRNDIAWGVWGGLAPAERINTAADADEARTERHSGPTTHSGPHRLDGGRW